MSNAPAMIGQASPIELPPLPYERNALSPCISANTVDFHYGKHHAAYVTNTANLVKGTDLEGASIEKIVAATVGKADRAGLFNNAAQVWNHSFYWRSLAPGAGGVPKGALAEMIASSFGSYAAFKEKFAKAAAGRFGSGWAWLVAKGGALEIVTTPNAETPLTVSGQTPLLTLDVWEHAYYLDYQNKRPDYIGACIDKLLNWDFAAANLEKA
jgi:Fe-Mn family superoxide dismutase